MLRSSGKFVNTVTRAIKLSKQVCPSVKNHFISSSILSRYYSSNVSEVDPVALQMINYGVNHARSQRTDESYGQGILVLEQCISSNTRKEDIQGIALLAMSTLLTERGDYSGAVEKLEKVQELTHSNLSVKVAAMEGLIGLNLEMGQDIASSKLADTCLQLVNSNLKHGSHDFEVIKYIANAIKGLVELVLGNHGAAETYYGVVPEDKSFPGNAVLSHGEFLHASGKFSLAKEYYQKVIEGVPETESFVDPSSLATGNMVSAEVLLAASCALGQLEAHSGNFADAEKMLTSALVKAEEHFGSRHPKVGVVLTCIALMVRHKAKLEHSSSILMQEGLYRKAIDLLNAPSLEVEGGKAKAERNNIVALARGGYADILCVQQNRKGEGERMKNWAEATWKNHRLSLAEALEISEPSKAAVVDTRISRVL
ncbi:hypothetical protein MKW94_024294 [Papaver nudicaule]|uniref:Tetratricopeptide repeat (TPR)-like superfamily protein n=1 Tax=Papaver nudicaule TaxID=74823 RepID=A0AA41RUM2_PAPNU|nr:hypothetical protein [Papaver nudicaule]